MKAKSPTRQRRRRRSKSIELPAKFEPGFIREIDQRSALAARLRTSFSEVVEDIGGHKELSHTQLVLIERFVFLAETMRGWEVRIATKPKASAELLSRWIQALNSLNGLAKAIGLKRKRKSVDDLQSYLKKAKAG